MNFGTLYGQTAPGLHAFGTTTYGISWTLSEAAGARNAWFDFYPEIRLRHFWTKYCKSAKQGIHEYLVWKPFKGGLIVPEFEPYVFTTSTLAGRPIVLLDQFKEACNYQDQGTGADILAQSIAMLPAEVAAMLLMPVHDEVVFEVPESRAEDIQATVEATMIQAADFVLGGIIPAEVDATVGDSWAGK